MYVRWPLYNQKSVYGESDESKNIHNFVKLYSLHWFPEMQDLHVPHIFNFNTALRCVSLNLFCVLNMHAAESGVGRQNWILLKYFRFCVFVIIFLSCFQRILPCASVNNYNKIYNIFHIGFQGKMNFTPQA